MSTKKMQIIGLKGKSAYQYAQDGGYTGTEAEFKEKMAGELKVVYDYEDLNDKILATTIKPEVSGEFIHLTDSAALPIMNFGMEGKTEQNTVPGNQLFDVNLIKYYTSSGITASIDGTILTLNGTNTSTAYIEFDLPKVIPMGTQVSFTLDNVTANSNVAIRLQSSGVSDGNTYFALDKTNKKITVTTSKNCDSLMILVNPTTINMLFSIMLSKNGNAELEPYTGAQPSPNPDYPQEIINAGTYNEATGRYEIGCNVVTGNLLPSNSDEWLINYTTSWAGNAGTKPEYYAGANYSSVIIIDARPDTTMCFHNDTTDKYWVNRIIEIDNNGIGWQNNVLYYNESYNFKDYSFKTTSKTYKLIIQVRLVDDTQTFTEADLQEMKIAFGYGDSVTYTPHQSTEFTLTSPVPITKWDKLVKRDGVWGWSVNNRLYEVTGNELFDSGNDAYMTGSSTNLHFILNDFMGSPRETQNVFCKELKYVWNIMSLTDGTIGIANFNKMINIRLPNTLIGVSDDGSVSEKRKSYIDYLQTRYEEGNPLKLLYQTLDEQSFHPLPDSEQTLLKSIETYYQVTNIFNDQNCPMSIQYIADTQTYVDNLANSLTNAVVSLGGEV